MLLVTLALGAAMTAPAQVEDVPEPTPAESPAPAPAPTPAPTPALTARLAAPAVQVGRSTAVVGEASPARPGDRVVLQRRTATGWQTAATAALSETSAFRFRVAPTTPGWHAYRVLAPAAADRPALAATPPRLDAYRLTTYTVATRGRVSMSRADFSAAVAATYADRRGWLRGHRRFAEVPRGGRITVVLAQARYVPTYGSVCHRLYSCWSGRAVVINDTRWHYGTRYFPGPIEQYRQMVLNHETGHYLGRRHAYCPRRGALAPVMQQQSKGLNGCRPNAWPLTRELTRLR